MTRHRRRLVCLLAGFALVLAVPTATSEARKKKAQRALETATDPALLQVVDCLLPGQLRRLGRRATYMTPRRPARITALDCSIRGGEYVAHDRADHATALAVWLEAANGGDPEAQYYVGEIFEKGLGTHTDPATAASWYRRAAEAGYARAQISLGFLYERGLGVEQDPVQALEWYRRAAGGEAPGLVLDDAAADLERRVEELAAELERERVETTRLSEALETARADVERARTESAGDVADLEAALLERQVALDAQRAKVEELEAVRARGVAVVPDERPAAVVPSAPPEIELIDPPLLKTRGVEIVASAAAQRELVGRVTSAAGLFSFTVNGEATTVDANGLFRSSVPLRPGTTPVELVAIDRAGERTAVAFEMRADEPQAAAAAAPPPPAPEPGRLGPKVDFGSFHALIIGNNEYAHLPDLDTAVRDAEALGAVLERDYGYRVRTLRDATRHQVMSALYEVASELTEKDNLLVYYAGHGELNRVIDRGYWLPVDAERTNPANWISTADITDYLSFIPAKQILVVADSCYSGALTRSSLSRLERGTTDEARVDWLRQLATKRARIALTSGGLQPVLDAGGGGHSVFCKALLDVLGANDDVLEGRRLFLEVSARVVHAAAAMRTVQEPEYAPIRFAGHETGDFFFVRTER